LKRSSTIFNELLRTSRLNSTLDPALTVNFEVSKVFERLEDVVEVVFEVCPELPRAKATTDAAHNKGIIKRFVITSLRPAREIQGTSQISRPNGPQLINNKTTVQ
jgi:hypothetical protein